MSDSVLEMLSFNRVVDFDLSKDKRIINIAEACDSCFAVELTKAQFGELIEELKALHESMAGEEVKGE